MLKKLKLRKVLRKQHYGLVGKHSGVQVCRWAKKDLIDDGECYKAKFYGIKSHQCCQMSVTIGFCNNRCIHCWRAIELTLDKEMKKDRIDNPKEIVDGCIEEQRRLINGFKGNKKINLEKFKQAQEPMQFAISLTGEGTLYPKIGELVAELRSRGKTTFIVTNGLKPNVLEKISKENNLPTQLYISMNSPNKELFDKWHNSLEPNAWEKFNESLELFPKLKTRKVIRMTLVKGPNDNMKDEMIKDYAELIKKASPDFIEVKGYKSVGFARKREGMCYESMPSHNEIKNYAKKIAKSIGYLFEDDFEPSCVVLLKRDNSVKRFIS